ncbi:MAG: transporter substrate-binding domain-containing protein [Candidatus Bipolaricaulia bacterium]
MYSRTWRLAFVLAFAVGLAIGMGLIPQAQQKPYIVCSDIPWDPFEMVTAGGEYFGFDLDVMRMIAILEGYEIEIQNMAFDAIIPAVQAGKCDLGASGFTITAEREEVVDFSKPYYLSNQAVVIRSDSGLNIVTALSGMGPTGKVGAQRGTTGAAWVEDNLIAKGVKVELVQYETYPLAILDLVNRRIDAVVQDEPASKASVAAYPNELTIAGIINTYEYFGFLVANGDPLGLLPKLNEGMVELGLRAVETAAGIELQIMPGTPWANLVTAYFGPAPDKIEACWLECKDKLLKDKDVGGFAACMASCVTR